MWEALQKKKVPGKSSGCCSRRGFFSTVTYGGRPAEVRVLPHEGHIRAVHEGMVPTVLFVLLFIYYIVGVKTSW